MEENANEENAELLHDAEDWQKQFHALKSRIEEAGYAVSYGENGEPEITAPPAPAQPATVKPGVKDNSGMHFV